MHTNKKVLLTGATGLIGSHLLKVLLTRTNYAVFLIIRGKNSTDSVQRLKLNLRKIEYTISPNESKRIKVFCGDLTEKNFGLKQGDYSTLCKEVSIIYHSAALAEFRQPLWKVRMVNVGGTRNLIKFILSCNSGVQLHYVSTAFIVGRAGVNFGETEFDLSQRFNNTYEQSKFETERLIRRFIKNGKLTAMIYRPSIVVGDYVNGITNNFRMFYQPFRTLSFELLKEIPVMQNTRLNLIPCDKAALAIYLLSTNFRNKKVYHIISPKPVKIMNLMQFASNFFGYQPPKYMSPNKFNKYKLTPVLRKIIEPYFPYFTFQSRFRFENAKRDLKKAGYSFPEINNLFLRKIFRFAVKKRYIRVKGKT